MTGKRTRIINDPSDLVPLLQAFGSDVHKKIFDELSREWRTERELSEIVGDEASVHRSVGNKIYNRLASWMVGQRIVDLTSGFRAAKAGKFKQFLYLLPNGFSYPTTITMSFFRAGYGVAYVPIHAPKRIGGSHLRLGRDGLRFFLIIFKIGSLYSPLKLFAPAAFLHFMLGVGYYAYTFATQHRFSSMTVFLLSASVTIFMIGLVSEQITALMYKDSAGGE